jgi:hypothetical protein
MKNLKNISLALVGIIIFSCNNDDNNTLPPPPPVTNEEELITTVKVTLTNGGSVITLQSKDLDGDGPNVPVVTASGNLTANTTYSGIVEFLNESVNPADNITKEIEEEEEDHQIFYQLTSGLGLLNYTDIDANSKPVGLTFSYQTSTATSGNIIVTLKHLPNKSASGVPTGDITNAGGSTDAQVTIPVTIQ